MFEKKIDFLEKFYFLLLAFFFFFIIFVNFIVQGDISASGKIFIEEEYVESFFILILLFLSYAIFIKYKKEIDKNRKIIIQEKKQLEKSKVILEDSFKYIGEINVQIQEINEVIKGLKEFPEKKNDFKNILNFLIRKALSIVNNDWVLLRVIDLASGQTLMENLQLRKDVVLPNYKISNQKLISEKMIDGYGVETSEQCNLGLKAFLIFPKNDLKKEQRVLIKMLINQLEMIYIIFKSKYYQKKNE